MLALGRIHGLAGRWHAQLEARGTLTQLIEPVRNHLWSEHLRAQERVRMARWEADRIDHALRDQDYPVVLLKGAAYILAELPPGTARMLSDVDILVPQERLAEAETALKEYGWRSQPHSSYDEHYYREWMHELPPLVHTTRGAVVDLHHNILPRTSRLCPDAATLISASLPLPGSRLRILAPADMVLHSIVHGFYGGEFANCWRDVLDVHELISHFAAQIPDFWPTFEARTTAFHFERPTYYALQAAHTLFGTAVPPAIMAALSAAAPIWPLRALMNWAIRKTLLPALPPNFLERCALRGLYLRSHWVKMPPGMLTRHLWTKYQTRGRSAPSAA